MVKKMAEFEPLTEFDREIWYEELEEFEYEDEEENNYDDDIDYSDYDSYYDE